MGWSIAAIIIVNRANNAGRISGHAFELQADLIELCRWDESLSFMTTLWGH
jgi:hypothetical protein